METGQQPRPQSITVGKCSLVSKCEEKQENQNPEAGHLRIQTNEANNDHLFVCFSAAVEETPVLSLLTGPLEQD